MQGKVAFEMKDRGGFSEESPPSLSVCLFRKITHEIQMLAWNHLVTLLEP
jgi:hypothetical protein